MTRKRFVVFLIIVFIVLGHSVYSQNQVTVNLDVKHKLGDVETFNRQKFVNFHSTIHQPNWNSGNAVDDLRDELLNKYDVYVGRNTGGISWTLNNNLSEDPTRPGFANPDDIAKEGLAARNKYAGQTSVHPYEHRSELILCTQIHPFYPDGKTTNKGWSFSQADTEEEPFGTASGEFYGRYIKESFGTGGTTGEPLPTYVEVVNEPLWDLVTVADNPHDLTKIYRFHETVANEVRKYNPGIPVGGYCAAFPDFDKDNFDRWHERDKHFIDVAGKAMDFWTIHLYDFPVKGGKQKYRKGSNMEATMDMLEQYSYMSLGEVKPLMISEYNAQTHDYNNEAWSPYRDWLKIKSTNSMMMQFMERANNINIAMPFIMLKSEWAYNANVGVTSVHGSRMMRRANEPNSFTGDYVFSELVKVYQLWSEVKGTRVDSKSDNLDILTDAYVDGNKAHVIVNSLLLEDTKFNMSVLGMGADPAEIEVRYCYLRGGVGGKPMLEIDKVSQLSNEIELRAEGTYIFTYTFDDEIDIDKTSDEKKYYSDVYLQEIVGNKFSVFNINEVELENYGEAVLRVGVGRNHGRSLNPTVKINGTKIQVPSNFRGDSQADRDNFFGVLEIPFDYSLLATNNKIEVGFPDNGGYISTVTLQTFTFSEDIRTTKRQEKSNDKSRVKIFPNPTQGVFHVNTGSDQEPFQLRVFNVFGSKILESIGEDGNAEISMDGFPSGLYLVEVSNSNLSVVEQLLIN